MKLESSFGLQLRVLRAVSALKKSKAAVGDFYSLVCRGDLRFKIHGYLVNGYASLTFSDCQSVSC